MTQHVFKIYIKKNKNMCTKDLNTNVIAVILIAKIWVQS